MSRTMRSRAVGLEELAQGLASRAEVVELGRSHSVDLVGPHEFGDGPQRREDRPGRPARRCAARVVALAWNFSCQRRAERTMSPPMSRSTAAVAVGRGEQSGLEPRSRKTSYAFLNAATPPHSR